jgi:hypothetical protein
MCRVSPPPRLIVVEWKALFTVGTCRIMLTIAPTENLVLKYDFLISPYTFIRMTTAEAVASNDPFRDRIKILVQSFVR